jgi:4-oxalocrotonate tautomerase
MDTDRRFADVGKALEPYFDGLYESNTRKLAQIFHPKAIYATATSGELLRLDMEEYFKVVDKRPSPASRNEPRRDAIASIEFAGPVTALVRLHCAIGPRYFTDLLTLIHLDGRWQIIAKVFHYEETGAAPA